MKNVLFVLVNNINPTYFKANQVALKKIHKDFLSKIKAPKLVVGDLNNQLSTHCFADMKQLYQFVLQQSGFSDIIWCDAFASLINMEDCAELVEYTRKGFYDVCLTENLPYGLLPNVISASFGNTLGTYLTDGMPIVSNINQLIHWESKGIDVGIYLSPSSLLNKRLEFLPHTQNGLYLVEQSEDQNLRLLEWENFFKSNPYVQRFRPQYIAIEIHPKTDTLWTRSLNLPEMSLEVARKIATEIEFFAPDALISLGIWGEPFMHSQFKEIFSIFSSLPNKILVESRTLTLNEEYWSMVLQRKNTELIFDISAVREQDFQQFKRTDFSLSEAVKRIATLPKDHVWPRLTRCPQTEVSIKDFFKVWLSYTPRVLIQKADSLGKKDSQVVDLSPLTRHSCYALRREMTILSDGMVLLCRQSTSGIGSVANKTLKQIWDHNQTLFLQQEKEEYTQCAQCALCDDWWIWN